jgi:hypothetical protein
LEGDRALNVFDLVSNARRRLRIERFRFARGRFQPVARSSHNLRSHRVAMLDAIGSLLVGVFGALLAWRTGAGALVLKEVGETSAILGWPVWVAQALMVPGFLLLGLAGFYLAGHRLRVALSRGEVHTR